MQPTFQNILKYSVIIPVFNEDKSLPELYRRLVAVMARLDGSFEIIFVNDGSHDRSHEVMMDLHKNDPRVKIVHFSRNFGHQVAITAGLDHACGEAVIILDADLQDPPEVIPQLIEAWKAGGDVIYAVRTQRKGESRFKLWAAAVFYRILKILSNIEIPIDAGDFRLLDSKVVHALRTIREKHRFIRGLTSWVGFKQSCVPYERDERHAGQTKYSLRKMIRLAMDGITSFSHLPLRLVTLLGLLCFALSAVMGFWALYVKLFTDLAIPGWTSLMGISLFLGGTQLLALGIIGEYLGRVFDEVKNRPLYVLRETYGFEKSDFSSERKVLPDRPLQGVQHTDLKSGMLARYKLSPNGRILERAYPLIVHILAPLLLFTFAFFLRTYFFGGFILGDDPQEFGLNQHIVMHGPMLQDQLHQRFGVWLFNALSFKIFGFSEMSFFLPSWILSASFGVMGYYILLMRYRPFHAFLMSLFVASAPFEVLIGSVHANDLNLSWFLALGLMSLFLLEKRPILQGTSIALLLWLGFHVKPLVVYVVPCLALYYFVQIYQTRIWRGMIAFCLTSFLFHGLTSLFWKVKLGLWFPFLVYQPATYPIPTRDLVPLFLHYPKMIFSGSEFGTTLFGFIPYAWIIFLIAKFAIALFAQKKQTLILFDRLDISLLIYCGVFFLLMNFFPHSFKFDQYYSAPRIFRYLSPLSFPMTLHLAKLFFDVLRFCQEIRVMRWGVQYAPGLLFFILILINMDQTDNATKPGQIYRKALVSMVNDIQKQDTPQLLAESWLSFFLGQIYLREWRDKIVPIHAVYKAEDYEQWLKKNQPDLPEGTLLITGLGSYVHYGAHLDGFRLRRFTQPLDSHWVLLKEYDLLTYLPLPEPARLWRLSGQMATP